MKEIDQYIEQLYLEITQYIADCVGTNTSFFETACYVMEMQIKYEENER